MKVGREQNSISLEADAHHLMTDVWTSAGVIAGVGLVWVSDWLWLDPVIAMLVALNILWTAWRLMQRSASGLMDASLPAEQLKRIETLLAAYREQGLDFHAVRTRQSGNRAFVTLHVLVPGHWTVQLGHEWADRIELDIGKAIPRAHITTHLEPMEDPVSMDDQGLDRPLH
jgi:cation diffusion facilitator family transporter